MKTFDQFMRNKKWEALAQAIVACDLDEQAFCEAVADYARRLDPNSPEVLNEFWGGVGNIANAGMRGLGRMVGTGARAVGGAIGGAARAVGGAIGQGARAVGGAIGQGAQAVGQGMQHVGNLYHQGENKDKLSNAIASVQGLQQNLAQMGFSSPQVDRICQGLIYTLQQAHGRVSQDASLRFGNPAVWGR